MNLSIQNSCLKIILCMSVHLVRSKIVIFISILIKNTLRSSVALQHYILRHRLRICAIAVSELSLLETVKMADRLNVVSVHRRAVNYVQNHVTSNCRKKWKFLQYTQQTVDLIPSVPLWNTQTTLPNYMSHNTVIPWHFTWQLFELDIIVNSWS
jgi:hypothetical protein